MHRAITSDALHDAERLILRRAARVHFDATSYTMLDRKMFKRERRTSKSVNRISREQDGGLAVDSLCHTMAGPGYLDSRVDEHVGTTRRAAKRIEQADQIVHG
jgi:hypothetical protein